MEYGELGRTGRTVSRLGFGGAPAGLKNYLEVFDPERAADRDAVTAAVRRALELGITYFDTAPGYGDGASERILGEGLKDAPPDNIFLATKVGTWAGGEVRASLEKSLRNLRRDWIDLLQVHGSFYTPEQEDLVLRPGGMLDQLEQLRAEGLVRHIGFTVESVNESTYRFIRTGRFDVTQILYNLLFQHPYDPGLQTGALYDAEARGMGIVTMRTGTSGIFQRWIQAVNPGNTFDYTQSLIQFNLSNPLVDAALVGMRTVDQVEANVRLVEDVAGRIDLGEIFRRYV